MARDTDADTLRQRAIYDRRGKVIITGVTQTELGPQRCSIAHSVAGRSDQYDLTIDGQIVATTHIGLVLERLIELNYST